MRAKRWMIAAAMLAGAALVHTVASARTIEIPQITAGVSVARFGVPKPLSPAQLAMATGWLKHHQSGWNDNLATPPTESASISLDTVQQKAVLTLIFWPGRTYVGWNRSVIVTDANGRPLGIQTFTARQLAPLFRTVP